MHRVYNGDVHDLFKNKREIIESNGRQESNPTGESKKKRTENTDKLNIDFERVSLCGDNWSEYRMNTQAESEENNENWNINNIYSSRCVYGEFVLGTCCFRSHDADKTRFICIPTWESIDWYCIRMDLNTNANAIYSEW